MDQLTISTVPEVKPSVDQVQQLAATFSEVAAEVFSIAKQGVQVKLELRGKEGMQLRIYAPLDAKTQLLAYCMMTAISLQYGRPETVPRKLAMSHYVYFESVIPDTASFEYTDSTLQHWLNQLNTVNRHINLFRCSQPSPLTQAAEC